jgi:hypothetical protein
MPERQKPGASATIKNERRRRPRPGVDRMDWETKVLKRMERRLSTLSLDHGHHDGGPADLDWEKASIMALRSHIRT